MSCFDPRGNFSNVYRTGEALDNGLGNNDDLVQHYLDQQEAGTFQIGIALNHPILNLGSMNDHPPQLPQQPATTFQFGTPPDHPILNPGSINVHPPQLAQQPGGASQFATTPLHAKVNSRSMNVRPSQWAGQPGAVNNVKPSISTQMNSFLLAEPGTSVSSNITNADAAKRARKKECDRKFRERKEKERRENAEKVVEFADEINDLRKDNERLEKERVEAKIKQTNSDQIISDLKEEVSRLTNEKKIQTMQVAVLSEIVVSSPEATDVAEENKLFKRKIELLMTSTNNPDIIKTVELQEENEKLKRENKKLRILNDALCDKLSKDDQ